MPDFVTKKGPSIRKIQAVKGSSIILHYAYFVAGKYQNTAAENLGGNLYKPLFANRCWVAGNVLIRNGFPN